MWQSKILCELGGGEELHMKELRVHYPNMLQSLHYIHSIQYYNYRNAVHLSRLTLQSLLVTVCAITFSIKKFYVLSKDCIDVSLGC